MSRIFKTFYRTFYNKTNGFIPSKPLHQNILPGDFFQIQNGEIIGLGNIYRNNIISRDNTTLEKNITLNPANWNFNEGVTQVTTTQETTHRNIEGDILRNKQELAFNDQGNFFFKSTDPKLVKIANWGDIKNQLIIKLTQTLFSFREVYVVTDVVAAQNWALAIAGAAHAEIEITSKSENGSITDSVVGDSEIKALRSKNIALFHKEAKRRPTFFKAKRLAIQQEKTEVFISELIDQHSKIGAWVEQFYDVDFYHKDSIYATPVSKHAEANVLDMLQANQLNPNTALQYFTWQNTSLDDVEKLLI